MDSNITSSYNDIGNLESRMSSSISNDDSNEANAKLIVKDDHLNTSGSHNVVIHSKNPKYSAKRLSGLRPIPKGKSGNPAGKPKGIVQVKDSLRKRFKKENADKVCDAIVKGAESGDSKATDFLLKLTGDLSQTSEVTVNNNSLTISNELIDAAKEYLNNQQNIIDVTPTDVKKIEDKQ